MSVSQKIYQNDGNPVLLERAPPCSGLALDVGCGAGDNAAQLVARGWTVDGITLSEAEAKEARRFCRRVDLYNLEQGLPPSIQDDYDLVICSHVLEHICFPGRLLADIRGRLSAQGRLIVALPNLLWWKNRLRLMRGQFEYTETGIMDNTHFRWYTYTSAQQLLINNGFAIDEAYPDGGIPISRLRNRLPRWSFSWADEMVRRLCPGLVAWQMIFVATKVEQAKH